MKEKAKQIAFNFEIKEGIKFGDHAMMLAFRGSVSHGTYRPPTEPNSIDDIDTVGVALLPIEYYFGFHKFTKGKQVDVNEFDMVFYDIRHFFSLLLNSNPNVLSTLFLRPQYYIHTTKYWDRIVENRNLFISKAAFKSFCGYANDQLKKMNGTQCTGRLGAKRKALIEKYGYDVKKGSTLIMILRQGIELLLSGELNVFRPDWQELLEIKDGKYKKQEIIDMAEGLFREARVAYEQSPLPEEPNRVEAEKLLINIIIDYYKEQKIL